MDIETKRKIAEGAVQNHLSYSIDDLLDSADTQVERLIDNAIVNYLKKQEDTILLTEDEKYSLINLIWNNINLDCYYTSGNESIY